MPTPIGNFFMRAIILSPFHALLGGRFGVITVSGRKSGKRISTPINVMLEGGSYTVVSMRSRIWWRNLKGDALAHLHVSGKDIPVRAQILEDVAEVADGLARYFTANPEVAKYFNLKLDANGIPDPESVRTTAAERVIVRLRPA